MNQGKAMSKWREFKSAPRNGSRFFVKLGYWQPSTQEIKIEYDVAFWEDGEWKLGLYSHEMADTILWLPIPLENNVEKNKKENKMDWHKVEDKLPSTGVEVAVFVKVGHQTYYDFRKFDPGTGWGGSASKVIAWSYFEPWKNAPNLKAEVITTSAERDSVFSKYFFFG